MKSSIRIRTSWGPFLHFPPCCGLAIFFIYFLDLEKSTRNSCRWTSEKSVLILLPDFSCESVQSLVCFFYTGETGPHTHAQLNVFKGMSVSMPTYFISVCSTHLWEKGRIRSRIRIHTSDKWIQITAIQIFIAYARVSIAVKTKKLW